MKDTGFVEYVKEILEPFGPIKVRAMFGGYGVYRDEAMFATIVYNELYFRATPESAEYFKSQGSEPFIYTYKNPNRKPITLPYWKATPEVLDDFGQLSHWFNLAYQAAKATKKPSKLKKP